MAVRGYMPSGKMEGGKDRRESNGHTYTTMHKRDSSWKLLDGTGSDDPEECDGDGWEGGSRRRGYNLLCYTAETNTTLGSNYPPI